MGLQDQVQRRFIKLGYKARLVVKDFWQKKDINFDEIFSLVVKMASIKVVLASAVSMDLEVEQLTE